MYTQKDFRTFAALIKSEREHIETERQRAIEAEGEESISISGAFINGKEHELTILATRLAILFGNENPRFKSDMFLKACGLERQS
jgi:hypothetical protein